MSGGAGSVATSLIEGMLPRGGSVLTLYRAFFDESYTDSGTPLLALGGYVLTDAAARQMTVDWQSVLDKAGIEFFHATDFGPGKVEMYSHLSDEERVNIQTELIAIIRKHVTSGVVVMINPARFDDRRDSYAWCCWASAGVARACMPRDGQVHDLAVLFEQGHESSGLAVCFIEETRQDFKSNGLVSVSLGDKRRFPILQAADLLVWHSAKFIKDMVAEARPIRRDFAALASQRHAFGIFMKGNKEIHITEFDNPSSLDEAFPELVRAVFGSGEEHDSTLAKLKKSYKVIHRPRS